MRGFAHAEFNLFSHSLTADSLGYNAVIKIEEYTTRLPSNCDDTRFYPDSPSLPLADDSVPERNNSFYLAKLR